MEFFLCVVALRALLASVPFAGFVAANLLGYSLSVPLGRYRIPRGRHACSAVGWTLTSDATSRVGIALATASVLPGIGAVSLRVVSTESEAETTMLSAEAD